MDWRRTDRLGKIREEVRKQIGAKQKQRGEPAAILSLSEYGNLNLNDVARIRFRNVGTYRLRGYGTRFLLVLIRPRDMGHQIRTKQRRCVSELKTQEKRLTKTEWRIRWKQEVLQSEKIRVMKTDVLELVRGFVDFDSMETGDYVKFRDTSGTRQDLVFERLYGSRLAVGHTFIQNGDVMKDPECVISVSGEPGRRFVSPVEITQHPVGIYRRADDMRDPTEIIDLLCLVLRNAKW